MSEQLHDNLPADVERLPLTITHNDPSNKKAIKLFLQGPDGPPRIVFIEPGESADVVLADCFECHLVEWNAKPVGE